MPIPDILFLFRVFFVVLLHLFCDIFGISYIAKDDTRNVCAGDIGDIEEGLGKICKKETVTETDYGDPALVGVSVVKPAHTLEDQETCADCEKMKCCENCKYYKPCVTVNETVGNECEDFYNGCNNSVIAPFGKWEIKK